MRLDCAASLHRRGGGGGGGGGGDGVRAVVAVVVMVVVRVRVRVRTTAVQRLYQYIQFKTYLLLEDER